MSTLQSILVFPLVFLLILFLFQMGPSLYQRADEASSFHIESLSVNLREKELYNAQEVSVSEDISWMVVSASAERMHFLIKAIHDSVNLIGNEVSG